MGNYIEDFPENEFFVRANQRLCCFVYEIQSFWFLERSHCFESRDKMSKDGKFSKFIPNVKLATRLDAEGNEVDVEKREDSEGEQHKKMIFDLLMSAGYFRVMIRNLSDFDKIVGGMSWCIEACDFDVEVDLLFHENLTIGQKM